MKKINRKHYDEGMRKAILEVTLSCGCLPYRAIRLLNMRTESVQKTCKKMVDEGLLKKYTSEKKARRERIWAMVLNGDQQLIEQFDTILPEHLLTLYSSIAINDKYKITSGNVYPTKLRVIRNAETFMFFYGAGIDTLRGRCENMRKDDSNASNIYYTSRELKGSQVDEDGLKADLDASNRVNTTRVNGVYVSDGGTYLIYNTNRYLGNYSLSGERKLKAHMDIMMSWKNKDIIDSAMLLADNMEFFKKILNPPSQLAQQHLQGLEGVYKNIYALPLNQDGQKMMKLMSIPDWQEKIYSNVLTMEQRTRKSSVVECDGQDDNRYLFVFCVPNIRRLKMFYKRAKIENDRDKYAVMCFDTQKKFLTEAMGNYVKIYSTSFHDYYNYIMDGK